MNGCLSRSSSPSSQVPLYSFRKDAKGPAPPSDLVVPALLVLAATSSTTNAPESSRRAAASSLAPLRCVVAKVSHSLHYVTGKHEPIITPAVRNFIQAEITASATG